MRLVGCVPVRPPSALLVNGCSGSGLIGPWPEPAGGSCQSATLVCQPNSADARLGISGSARAVVARAKRPIERPTKTPPCKMVLDIAISIIPAVFSAAERPSNEGGLPHNFGIHSQAYRRT